jgi:DnaK suppressor protein
MNEMQQEYFRRKLKGWRDKLLEEYEETRSRLSSADREAGDLCDTANEETHRALELMTRDRERKLLGKIDQALERLQNGTYGFCAETGKPIGLARLEARPTAEFCIEAQVAHESREERQSRTREPVPGPLETD